MASTSAIFLDPQRQTYIHPKEATRCSYVLEKVATFGLLLGGGRILAAYYPSSSLFSDAIILTLSVYLFNFMSTIDADTGLDDYRLVETANKGNRLMVKFLLLLGANPNVNASNCALRTAVIHEDLEIAKDLLIAKADPNLRGKRNQTPLMEAVEKSQKNAVKLLLEYKANPLVEARKTPLNSLQYARVIHKQLVLTDKEGEKTKAAEKILRLLKEHKI